MTTGDPAGTPQTEWSLPRPGMHFILFGYFCIAVEIPSLPPCGVKTIRWKPSELGCHRPSPSSQSWTSMSMPITMGGSSSARCVFLLLLFVPNGDPQLDSCHHSVGRRFCHHCATRMSKYRMVADATDRGPMIQCSCLSKSSSVQVFRT